MEPITVEQRARILQFDTCKVANAIERMGVRLSNEGFTRPGLRHLAGTTDRVLGYAATSKVKCSDPPMRGAHPSYHLDDWWDVVPKHPHPVVAVIQDEDPQPGLGAVLSDTHAHVLMALGCTGLVTNGSVRDLEALTQAEFSVFAPFGGVSHSYIHIVQLDCPVQIFGLTVKPSDLVFVDRHGMILIPPLLVPDLIRLLEERKARESRFFAICKEHRPLAEIRRAARELA